MRYRGRGEVDRVEGSNRLGGKRASGSLHYRGLQLEHYPMVGSAPENCSPFGGHRLRKEAQSHRSNQHAVAFDHREGSGEHQLGRAEPLSDLRGPGLVKEPA